MSLHYTFSVEHAEKYGLNEAILLHNFIYWTKINQSNNHNFINGRYWTYNSARAFQELFPFWSQKQIQYLLSKMVENGIIIKDCFNKDKRDRTSWYSLSDTFFSHCILQNREMDDTKLGNDILQNREMYNITDKKLQIKNTDKNNNKDTASGFSRGREEDGKQTGKNKKDLPHSLPPSKQNQFQEFYNLYNHKVKKPNAEVQFKKALSKASFQEIMDGAKKYQEWLDLEKINFPTKQKQAPDVWLKSERWADDYTSLIAVEKDKIKSSGKTVPVPQKSPEKVQEEVNYKETLQSKRKAIVELLNENERNFLIHIQENLKGMFSPPHYPWIDNMVFHCKKNATFGFMEQKHLDAIKINQEKFEGIARRELNVTDFKFEKIEIKLIDR